MASSYTIVVPTPPELPPTLEVYVTVGRRDRKALTREELEALAAVYPPPTREGRVAVEKLAAEAPTASAPKVRRRART